MAHEANKGHIVSNQKSLDTHGAREPSQRVRTRIKSWQYPCVIKEQVRLCRESQVAGARMHRKKEHAAKQVHETKLMSEGFNGLKGGGGLHAIRFLNETPNCACVLES